MCPRITKSTTFKSFSNSGVYHIRPEYLNCSSQFAVYLISCKTYGKQYVGSTVDFRLRFNNYKCAHKNFLKGKEVKQESFHAHFENDDHHGESDWEIKIIDQGKDADDIRRRESFWQYKLDTFQPNGLNDREVTLC